MNGKVDACATFTYQSVSDASSAIQFLTAATSVNAPLTQAPVQPIAGGTTLLDLMKLDVMRPEVIVDINPLSAAWSTLALDGGDLKLGAMARMSDVAANSDVQRGYPVVADALKLAASPQLRNMASLGGNVLQRTRCTYFRDVSYDACNKRNPGSGCAAMEGFNRTHAVLGTSNQCIATYPGRFRSGLDRARCDGGNHRKFRRAEHAVRRNCTCYPGSSPQDRDIVDARRIDLGIHCSGSLATVHLSQGTRPPVL